ncbi:MAG: TetR/AcrR family transcriptional regulator [Gammaproteobacteria bacterium]|nr:TetR/AcrR family transcriptional regulator [Gammaproteobacteria bacterium]
MKTRKPAAQYHHGDLQNALLEAAEALLERDGPARLSLREVARAAGVSHAAPYRHFRDKAALLRALSQRGAERLQLTIEDAAARAVQNPEQQLVEAGVAYVHQAVQHPEMSRLMLGDVEQGHAPAAFAALVRIIREGVASGAFRQRDAEELALAAWTAMHGLALLAAAAQLPVSQGAGAQTLDDTVRAVARNVMYGIAQ